MEDLARLEITFEDLRSHMTTAWNNTMVWVEEEVVFTEINTLMQWPEGRRTFNKVTTGIANEKKSRVLETLDACGRKSPSHAIPTNPLEDGIHKTHITRAS